VEESGGFWEGEMGKESQVIEGKVWELLFADS
jgi:hypothetical protein